MSSFSLSLIIIIIIIFALRVVIVAIHKPRYYYCCSLASFWFGELVKITLISFSLIFPLISLFVSSSGVQSKSASYALAAISVVFSEKRGNETDFDFAEWQL